MGQRTITEYVESPAINDAIQSIGRDFAQGYWIGPPLPLAVVLEKPSIDDSPSP